MFRGRYFPLFVVLFGISTRLLGQDCASVTGTVTDVSGAIVTSAEVTVSNLTDRPSSRHPHQHGRRILGVRAPAGNL